MEEKHARLSDGLSQLGLTLAPELVEAQLGFLNELERWNRKINLTSIRGLDAGMELHLIDSLILLPEVGEGPLLDVGSGAGLPSIPLALARSGLQVDSVEAVGKKVNFQRHIRRLFGLKNFHPHQCRIEDFVPAEPFAQITARAFASIELIVELVEPLLATGGELLLLRGSRDESDTAAVQAVLQKYALKIEQKKAYQLPFSDAGRHLLKISR